ncbi:MAG: hypothetical protein L7S67_02755 [Flavobacteriales bacterium]|nr:hypothetical protein [Flavobacteriales bacterium]
MMEAAVPIPQMVPQVAPQMVPQVAPPSFPTVAAAPPPAVQYVSVPSTGASRGKRRGGWGNSVVLCLFLLILSLLLMYLIRRLVRTDSQVRKLMFDMQELNVRVQPDHLRSAISDQLQCSIAELERGSVLPEAPMAELEAETGSPVGMPSPAASVASVSSVSAGLTSAGMDSVSEVDFPPSDLK